MTDIISLTSGDLSSEINPLGAQLFALRDKMGRDLLWNGDPAFWTGRAPILFPIIGELAGGQYRLDGQTYALSRHGFARNRLFAVAERAAHSALFRLNADDETRKLYPFDFELDLRFTLEASTLTITALIKNRGATAMPASFGFHPALRWPLPGGGARSDCRLLFAKDEPSPVRRLDAKGLLLPETFPTPVTGRELKLRDDLFINDALIFNALASNSLTYGADTGPQIEIAFPDTPYLGIWSKPGAPFICIEPWHGIADAQGFAGDFRDRKGIMLIPPGSIKPCSMSITLLP